MAVRPEDANFRSKLDDASKKKAKEELNEINDKDRLLAVQHLRKLVLEQSWIKSPTDFEFLLRFLRVRKYSQLAALESIEKYWSHKTSNPRFFHNADPRDPILQEILRSGFYMVPKQRDKNGCRVLIGNMGCLDANTVKKDWGIANVYKAIMLLYEWLIRDENAQVNGIKYFVDYTGTTMALATTFTGDDQKVMLNFFQKALPIRFKGMYLYNEPAFFDVLFAMVAPFISQKMKDRMHLVGRNMTRVYEHIDMAVLPDEYLPDEYEGPRIGPMSKIVDEMMDELTSQEFIDYMVDLSSDRYGADLKKKPDKGSDSVPTASFRKLNVD